MLGRSSYNQSQSPGKAHEEHLFLRSRYGLPEAAHYIVVKIQTL